MNSQRILLENATLRLQLELRGIRGAKKKKTAPSLQPQKSRDTLVGGRIERELGRPHIVALQDLNLNISDGQRVALIGHNGAGKTSLLRMLAGIYNPSEGRCIVRGKRAALLSIGLGFNGDMTLRENIRVALALYDVSFCDIDEMIPEILDFSELLEFADAPLNVCSAGMKARLGFGIATSVSPDIFLVDEVFGAGDARFASRARKRLDGVFDNARVLVLSSHSGTILEQFCNTAIWLEKGRIRAYGAIEDVFKEHGEWQSRRMKETASA